VYVVHSSAITGVGIESGISSLDSARPISQFCLLSPPLSQKKVYPAIHPEPLHQIINPNSIMTNLPQTAPPILSTPETHIFEDPTPILKPTHETRLTDEEVWTVYEIARTALEVVESGWRRVALQFPDGMLGDGVRVFEGLERELSRISKPGEKPGQDATTHLLEESFNDRKEGSEREIERHRLYILADTSYGACCVDEIAAEHVEAEVVVHYGRSCLSPTARLLVIYVFTSRALPPEPVIQVFENTYEEKGKEEKIILMADIIYHSHIPSLKEKLVELGYTNIIAPEIIHDPSSIIPNRKIDGIEEEEMKSYSLFHISDPPPALLLTLSSRVKELYIYPTFTSSSSPPPKALQQNTSMALRRRYALVSSLSTCPIFGILINTLSVRNYLETVTTIKEMIARAGKKSYTFVVGKVNAAKIANFSEIGGWVVIGCWESSLIESTEFYRPIITPFELQLALMGDGERVWKGDWRGDFASLVIEDGEAIVGNELGKGEIDDEEVSNKKDGGELDSEEESEPPEFDLRTGRYVSHSRPMRTTAANTSSLSSSNQPTQASKVLTRRAKGDLATVNGAVSPGAEYLRSQRTWTGLGSDFHEEEASSTIEEGRSGVARGYTVGKQEERR
jgi:diphthamide biosynthesis protein 2